MIYGKVAHTIQWRKDSLFTKRHWGKWMSIGYTNNNNLKTST